MKRVIRVPRVDGGAYFHLDPNGIVDYEPAAYDAAWSLITMSCGTFPLLVWASVAQLNALFAAYHTCPIRIAATAQPSIEEKAAA